jgi:hypothetical protein
MFRSRNGAPLCEIRDNELTFTPETSGDLICTASRFEIHDRYRRKALRFSLSTSGLKISHLAHVSGGTMILGSNEGLWVCNGVRTQMFKDLIVTECQVAISVNSRWVRNYEEVDIRKDPDQGSLQGLTIRGGFGAIAC